MINCTVTRCPAKFRSGLTIIDVIVIVFALLVLMLMLLPSIQRSGGVSRRLQCLNNMKGLALATTNFATSQNGALPLLVAPGPGLASGKNLIWAMQLMPYHDRADTLEYVTEAKTAKDAEARARLVLEVSYRFLQCGDDGRVFKQPGGISYAANVGYGAWSGSMAGLATDYDFGATDHSAAAVDWNGNGKLDVTDKLVSRATGVFWSADADEYRFTYDDFGDGTGSTILFADSMNLPPMHLAGAAGNGFNPRAIEVGVGLGHTALGLVKQEPPSLLVNETLEANVAYRQYFRPNANRGSAVGHWPAASSPHRGTINVAFADGHCSAISEQINLAVWAALHSPNGSKFGQATIADSEY